MQHTENERTVFNLNPGTFRGGDTGEVIPAGTFHDQAPDKFRGGDPGEVIPAGTFHDTQMPVPGSHEEPEEVEEPEETEEPDAPQGDSEGGE